jgi:hypothetical protein
MGCNEENATLRQEVLTLRTALDGCAVRERAERAGRLAAEESLASYQEKQNADLDRLRSRCLAEAECHKRAAEEVSNFIPFLFCGHVVCA